MMEEWVLPCLPAILRRSIARRHRRLVIEPGDASAQVWFDSGLADSGPVESAPLDLEQLGAGRIDLDQSGDLVERFGQERGWSTELRLPAEAVLIRTVSFPALVGANLPKVLGYELDRLSPFQSSEVVFDFNPLRGTQHPERLTLELAICRRDRIDGWIKRCSALGLPIERVSWHGAWPRANLLPESERPKRRAPRFSLNQGLVALAILLAIGAMLTPLWQKGQIQSALDAELRTLRAQAIAVDELRQELERAREGSTAVLQQKWDQPPILEMLRELTDRLPDDTWIQNLEFNEGQGDLRGESAHATALIAILEQANGISGVTFKSPVTQIARTGKERFNLSFSFERPRSE